MAVVAEAEDPSYQEFQAWRLAAVEAGGRLGLGWARPGDDRASNEGPYEGGAIVALSHFSHY